MYITTAVVNETAEVTDPGPPPVTTNVLGRWDASNTNSLTANASSLDITNVADVSGAGANAVREVGGTGGSSVVVPGFHGGRPVAIARPTLSWKDIPISAADRTQTLFWVGCIHDLSNIACLIGANTDNGRLCRVETTGRPSVVKRNVANLFIASASLAITTGVPFVLAWVIDTTTIKIFKNLVTPESTSESTTFSSATQTYIGGGDNTVAHRLDGYFCEAMICDGAYSDADVNDNIDFFMEKWDIS